MLDEQEFAVIAPLYRDGIRLQKRIAESGQRPPEITRVEDLFRPCLEAYERLTGFRETNANAVMHHRLALYGPPCPACGKPLRTPRAAKCMACGTARAAELSVAPDRRPSS